MIPKDNKQYHHILQNGHKLHAFFVSKNPTAPSPCAELACVGFLPSAQARLDTYEELKIYNNKNPPTMKIVS